ncbi:MAG: DUF1232 domain-containing protein [Acidobacteria bacterium]|nr:DUF1232 domain-containing protein [Acidobacteriota bacterium]
MENNDEDLNEPEILNAEIVESMPAPTKERADRFYDRLRRSISRYLEKRGKTVEKTAEYVLLVPDVFNLLWRLANDSRVSGKNKVLLGSGIAYYVFPLDFMPDIVPGVGFLDDLVFAVYVLNKMLADTEAEVLREHWAGDEDVLAMIRRVIGAADTLVSKDFLGYVKKMLKRD